MLARRTTGQLPAPEPRPVAVQRHASTLRVVTLPTNEERWRAMLGAESREALRLRRTFRRIPSAPRCKMCHAPFKGIGGFVLKPWFGPWEKNPQLCKSCIGALAKQGPGGAEIDLTLLFADIRGSTSIGERLRPTEFSALLHAFYRLAAGAITEHDGVVDKFVGDEAIGLFIPGLAGNDHAAKGVAAGRALLEAVARPNASSDGPIPVGAGVHTGIAYVGSVGSSDEISDFTALGDVVNSTARLASLAAAGELLVSTASADQAALDREGLELRAVDVRGREAGLDVLVVRPAG
jgi:adenylate cyclase